MNLVVWCSFLAIFFALLWLDLGVLHREADELSVRQALKATFGWIVVALGFALLVYGLYENRWFDWNPGEGGQSYGRDAVVAFVTGYVLEWSLSVDNIFVIALIFSYLRVPPKFQYRVLFWGIVGAIVLRGAMIATGTALIHAFDWMFYVFGGILLLSALRMLKSDEGQYDPSRSYVVRAVRAVFPVSEHLDGQRFFTRLDGRLAATPLFVALLLVDFADVVFAVDSIPAILAVTQDSFIVFTSNAFAILGLRALYFAIAGLMEQFRFVKYSLVLILAFVGVKMTLALHYHIPNLISLGVILSVLAAGVLASMLIKPRSDAPADAPPKKHD
ncbi:MAG TPA: TerC family protein [Steroidobacteraceae bacterium]|nr:TerC family protein [Steroidobacteraceae bacterium]